VTAKTNRRIAKAFALCGGDKRQREVDMRSNGRLALIVAAAFGLGAVTSEVLHAQSKPPAYQILEADVTNRDAYIKEFVPLVSKAVRDGGGKTLARGGVTYVLDGAPPGRIVVNAYESVDQAKAALTSPAYLAAKKIGDKYAKFRTFIVEGLAP
jgi:uncharacterized protein (DUF1330 family)